MISHQNTHKPTHINTFIKIRKNLGVNCSHYKYTKDTRFQGSPCL